MGSAAGVAGVRPVGAVFLVLTAVAVLSALPQLGVEAFEGLGVEPTDLHGADRRPDVFFDFADVSRVPDRALQGRMRPTERALLRCGRPRRHHPVVGALAQPQPAAVLDPLRHPGRARRCLPPSQSPASTRCRENSASTEPGAVHDSGSSNARPSTAAATAASATSPPRSAPSSTAGTTAATPSPGPRLAEQIPTKATVKRRTPLEIGFPD